MTTPSPQDILDSHRRARAAIAEEYIATWAAEEEARIDREAAQAVETGELTGLSAIRLVLRRHELLTLRRKLVRDKT